MFTEMEQRHFSRALIFNIIFQKHLWPFACFCFGHSDKQTFISQYFCSRYVILTLAISESQVNCTCSVDESIKRDLTKEHWELNAFFFFVCYRWNNRRQLIYIGTSKKPKQTKRLHQMWKQFNSIQEAAINSSKF